MGYCQSTNYSSSLLLEHPYWSITTASSLSLSLSISICHTQISETVLFKLGLFELRDACHPIGTDTYMVVADANKQNIPCSALHTKKKKSSLFFHLFIYISLSSSSPLSLSLTQTHNDNNHGNSFYSLDPHDHCRFCYYNLG